VGVDQELVINADEEIFEMNNGCICCTVRGDLIRILGNLMKRKDKFDAIMIETTGMADAGPVAQTFFVDDEMQQKLKLDGIVTVVDAKHVWQHIDDSDEVINWPGTASGRPRSRDRQGRLASLGTFARRRGRHRERDHRRFQNALAVTFARRDIPRDMSQSYPAGQQVPTRWIKNGHPEPGLDSLRFYGRRRVLAYPCECLSSTGEGSVWISHRSEVTTAAKFSWNREF
jgi:hypothetical protein